MTPEATSPSSPLWHFSSTVYAAFLGAIFMMTSVYLYLHQHNQSRQLHDAERFIEIVIDASSTNTTQNIDKLDSSMLALIREGKYDSISLYDNEKNQLFLHGLPIDQMNVERALQLEKRWKDNRKQFITFELNDTDQRNKYRLIAAINMSHAAIIGLEFIICTLLIFMLVAFFCFFYHRRLKRKIFSPLATINSTLQHQNKSNETSSIDIPHSGIYTTLIDNINRAFSVQKDVKLEQYAHIEGTHIELRESLESLEARNIELNIAHKRTVEKNILKSNFINKTCRHLNSPATNAIDQLHLLRKTPLTQTQEKHIDTIDQSLKDLFSITNDLQDLSQLEDGRVITQALPFKPRSLIDDLIKHHTPYANEHDINLYSCVDTNVPVSMVGDAKRMGKILSSLVNSSVDFPNATYVELTVTAHEASEDDVICSFSVNTDGRCSNAFFEWYINSETNHIENWKNYRESHMNLSIAKGIANYMNGHISFDNRDTGCVFTLEITLSKPSDVQQNLKKIDPAFPVHTLVFSSTEPGYRAINSRLSELGIRCYRAKRFQNILDQAMLIKSEINSHAKAIPLAIIEAKTSPQNLDKTLLNSTIGTLTHEFHFPVIIVSSNEHLKNLKSTLKDIDLRIIQQPITNIPFRKAILSELGIFKLNVIHHDAHSKKKGLDINVLLVDDNAANLKLATTLLVDVNISVTTAMTGAEALEKFNERRYDAVFMDIELPDSNGFEVTKKMREIDNQKRRTPIVALTAHNVVEEKINLLAAGMDDFVGKPLRPEDIQRILDRWIVNSQSREKKIDKPHAQSNTNDLKKTPKSKKTEKNTPKKLPELAIVSIQDSLSLTKNDTALARDMLTMLIDTLESDLNEMQEAHSTKDFDKLHHIVHRLHGGCCYTGVNALKASCKTLDLNLKNKTYTNIENELKDLYEKIDNLLSWSKEHDIAALFD